MIAHHHFTPEYVMERVSFGKLFVLFDGMSQYVMLTNGFGGGESDDESSAKPGAPTVDSVGNFKRYVRADGYGATAVAQAHGVHVPVAATDAMPEHIRKALYGR